ncbi:hypothetical protein LINGRAHAP2_LOCUS2130, partial [Linum grandiflorum]
MRIMHCCQKMLESCQSRKAVGNPAESCDQWLKVAGIWPKAEKVSGIMHKEIANGQKVW